MHDPKVLLWATSLIEVWHQEPGGADSGTVCRYQTMGRHPWHWQIKLMPLVRVRRRLQHCDRCGRRMNKASRFGYQGSDKVWHDECSLLGRLERDRLLLLEILDRVLSDVEDAPAFRERVERFEERDQFLLWYSGWGMLDRYRTDGPRWRAPNETTTE